jgi:2-hydroxychromene-2-carboxylate isomerase
MKSEGPGSPPPAAAPPSEQAFYFDLASPLAYLAAERVLHVLPAPAEWQPVLARELPGGETFEAFRCETEEQIFREEVERRARALDLQPLRWPADFPFDSAAAMRVATYAKSIGRAVPFAQAAFRQAFAGGHGLAQLDHVLIAAAACEMHPTAVLKGAQLSSIAEQLSAATGAAARAGVSDVPAVRVGERVWVGERAVEDAAAHMRATMQAATDAPAAGNVQRSRPPDGTR